MPRYVYMPRQCRVRLRGSTQMGRGRAKAKQTKVARDLKYRAVDTDFASLERELRSDQDDDTYEDAYDDSYADVPSQYADLAAQYNAKAAFDQDDVEVGFDDDDDHR